MKELEAAGARVITPLREAPGLFKLAFVQDRLASSWNSSNLVVTVHSPDLGLALDPTPPTPPPFIVPRAFFAEQFKIPTL